MRFTLTTIAIALLGSAIALPDPDINSVGERAAVSASHEALLPLFQMLCS
jgi:hypothetical protein